MTGGMVEHHPRLKVACQGYCGLGLSLTSFRMAMVLLPRDEQLIGREIKIQYSAPSAVLSS